MGAVVINRKRSEESLNLSHQSNGPNLRHSPYFQASKKRRFSFGIMSDDSGKPSSSSNPTISRISRYPDAKAPLRREIHAPSRANLRYGSAKAKPNDYCDKDEITPGNFFLRRYDNAKRTALGTLRFFKKDKELIDLVDEPEKEAVSDDSSVELVEVVDSDEEKLVEEEEEKMNLKPSTSSSDVRNGNNALRVDDTSTMMDSLSLGREMTTDDASSLEAYKKLLQSAERRNPKLEALSFEILLNENRLSHLRQSRPKPVEKKHVE
ncbi:hypothetical protein EUTSA_v100250610mg, partial [Eutrema salsugineum]